MAASTEYRVVHEAGELPVPSVTWTRNFVRTGSLDQAACPSHGLKKRSILIYRNALVERSETFVLAQANALERYQPIFCGLNRRAGGILPRQAPCAILSRERRVSDFWQKMAFMYLGHAPHWEQRCRAFHPALIHAHFAIDGTFAMPLQKSLKIPFVVTLHGYDVTSSDAAIASTRGGRLYLRRREEFFERVDLFICVSQFIRNKAIEHGYPEEKLWAHSIGIDLQVFHSVTGEEREPLVLFVGRLVEKKGCIHLIHAMRIAQRSMPNARLVVIGDGPLRNHLQEAAADILPGSFLFLGAQPAHIVQTWLRRARVFCVPSITAANGDAEGLGMVFCEAQAMGVPVVSFMSGGIPEAVVDGITGLLLREYDERGLSTSICKLLKGNADWAEMSLRGQQHVARNFNLQTQTKLLEAKYDEILSKRSDRDATRD